MSLFWFFYLGGLGIFFPYISLYLKENAGLGGIELGFVLAAFPISGLIAQPLWGYVADRTGNRAGVLVLITTGAAFGFAAFRFAHGFVWLLGAAFMLALFSTAVIPMTVSVHLAALGGDGLQTFGRVRVWGTVGFLALILAFPPILDLYQGATEPSGEMSEPGLEIMFPATGAVVILAALVGLAHPRGGEVALRARPGEWRTLLRMGPVLRLCLFAFLAFFFLHGPMVLFPVYVKGLGGDLELVSRLWIPMLLVEIPLIAWFGPAMKRLGARGMLCVGMLGGGARWLICGMTQDLVWIAAVQLLHGLGVMGLLLGGPLYLEQVVPKRLRSTGQGLYAACGVAIGGSCSSVFFSWLIDRAGFEAPYLGGGAGAILLALLVPVILPVPKRPAEP